MFRIGDEIAYPLYGAGIIEDIQKMEFYEGEQEYIKLRFLLDDMSMMLPTSRIQKSGLRHIHHLYDLRKILDWIQSFKLAQPTSTRQQLLEYRKKLKGGDLLHTATVWCQLLHQQKTKKLNVEEQDLFNVARKMLVSEIMLVKEIQKESADNLLHTMSASAS